MFQNCFCRTLYEVVNMFSFTWSFLLLCILAVSVNVFFFQHALLNMDDKVENEFSDNKWLVKEVGIKILGRQLFPFFTERTFKRDSLWIAIFGEIAIWEEDWIQSHHKIVLLVLIKKVPVLLSWLWTCFFR